MTMCFYFRLVKWELSLAKCNTKIFLSTSSKVESKIHYRQGLWTSHTIHAAQEGEKVKKVKSSPHPRNSGSPDSFGWEQVGTLMLQSFTCAGFSTVVEGNRLFSSCVKIQKTAIPNTSALSCKMTRICHTKLIPRQAAYIWRVSESHSVNF